MTDDLVPIAPAVPVVTREIAAMSPREAIERWFDRLAPKTREAYALQIGRFAAWLLDDPTQRDGAAIERALLHLCGLKTSGEVYRHLITYQDHLRDEGLSSATINLALAAVSSALGELGTCDLGHGKVSIPNVKAEQRRDQSGPPLHRVIAVLDDLLMHLDDPICARDALIIALAAQRGLRRSEIASLNVNDVNLDEPAIRLIRKGKREKVWVPIAESTAALLEHWIEVRRSLEAADDGLLIALGGRAPGRRLNGRSIYDLTRKYGWHPHQLRHTAISESLKRCANSLAVAKEFAGHAHTNTTMKYIDDKQRLESEGVQAMDDVLDLSKVR